MGNTACGCQCGISERPELEEKELNFGGVIRREKEDHKNGETFCAYQ
jgi:hypothetical protein